MWILFFLLPIAAHAFLLNDVMCKDDQERTGITNLSRTQRLELEAWLNRNFTPKTVEERRQNPEMYLSENIEGGSKVLLSDGTLYEVAPSDIKRASGWLLSVPIQLGSSGDSDYPYKLTNKNTGASIKARSIEPTS